MTEQKISIAQTFWGRRNEQVHYIANDHLGQMHQVGKPEVLIDLTFDNLRGELETILSQYKTFESEMALRQEVDRLTPRVIYSCPIFAIVSEMDHKSLVANIKAELRSLGIPVPLDNPIEIMSWGLKSYYEQSPVSRSQPHLHGRQQVSHTPRLKKIYHCVVSGARALFDKIL